MKYKCPNPRVCGLKNGYHRDVSHCKIANRKRSESDARELRMPKIKSKMSDIPSSYVPPRELTDQEIANLDEWDELEEEINEEYYQENLERQKNNISSPELQKNFAEFFGSNPYLNSSLKEISQDFKEIEQIFKDIKDYPDDDEIPESMLNGLNEDLQKIRDVAAMCHPPIKNKIDKIVKDFGLELKHPVERYSSFSYDDADAKRESLNAVSQETAQERIAEKYGDNPYLNMDINDLEKNYNNEIKRFQDEIPYRIDERAGHKDFYMEKYKQMLDIAELKNYSTLQQKIKKRVEDN